MNLNELTQPERDMLTDVIQRRWIGEMEWEKKTLQSLERLCLIEKKNGAWLPTCGAYTLVMAPAEEGKGVTA